MNFKANSGSKIYLFKSLMKIKTHRIKFVFDQNRKNDIILTNFLFAQK